MLSSHAIWITFILYLCFLLAVAIFESVRSRQSSVRSFATGGGSIKWPFLVMTYIASLMSTWVFFAGPGAYYRGGWMGDLQLPLWISVQLCHRMDSDAAPCIYPFRIFRSGSADPAETDVYNPGSAGVCLDWNDADRTGEYRPFAGTWHRGYRIHHSLSDSEYHPEHQSDTGGDPDDWIFHRSGGRGYFHGRFLPSGNGNNHLRGYHPPFAPYQTQ